jgi:hypothetical protein
LPISATDTITLAFRHTKRQLIEPFRFWQWTRLALVGLLAGEMGSSGSFNVPTNFPHQGGSSRHLAQQVLPNIDPVRLVALITILIVAGLVFGILLMYISSVMRFILFDSILAKECHIRQGWQRRQDDGWRFFLWQLGFAAVTLLAMAILFGIPAAIAYSLGWFKAPHDHLAGLILGGILMFFVLFIFFVVVAVIHVLTKDFVVPQMALEGIGAIEGWRRLLRLLEAEKGGYAGYVGMKIVLAIGSGIVIGLASVVLIFLLLVPIIALGLGAVLAGKAAGLTWNVLTITMAVVVGCVLFVAFMYLMALISVPVIVFFPAYAIYFFAPRYRSLSLVLYPPPPSPPPLAFAPEPIQP